MHKPADAKRQPPKPQAASQRRRSRQAAELARFDARYARFRVYLLESERAHRKALEAIAERDALRARRRALRWNGGAAAVASAAGLECDPFGPLPDETPGEFQRRVDRETPRLTLLDFERPFSWWDYDDPPPPREHVTAARTIKRRCARDLRFRGRRR